jgi:hypothetical protein
MKRGSWGTPKLIVLGRANPEEAVLDNCKLNNPAGGDYGPSPAQDGCFKQNSATKCNGACSSNGFGS